MLRDPPSAEILVIKLNLIGSDFDILASEIYTPAFESCTYEVAAPADGYDTPCALKRLEKLDDTVLQLELFRVSGSI